MKIANDGNTYSIGLGYGEVQIMRGNTLAHNKYILSVPLRQLLVKSSENSYVTMRYSVSNGSLWVERLTRSLK